MKNVVLFDIDGTLADGKHREGFLKAPEIVEKEHCHAGDSLMDDWRFCKCQSCGVPYKSYHALDCGFRKNFKKDWPAFFAAQHLDTPHPEMQTLWSIFRMAGGTMHLRIALLTSRPEQYRAVTEGWLEEHGFYDWDYDQLIMRPDGDQTDDNALKLQQAEEIFGLDKILCVFEDRSRIVKAWRDAGVFCCQVAEGNF